MPLEGEPGHYIGTHESLFGHFLEKQVVNENQNPDANSAVGDIERGPVQIIYVEVQKINDFAQSDSVDHISHSPAQDQGQATA